ncbi:hypothetical protein [Undibacterium sp.]|uniref:hypothetical protein n=1 Tax=Undibacterium sp. TaxID=1914977 RepID=UPI002B723F8E|nr:hypothetical protein [Undibacterium sp.]HTD04501.1 hypothetical protein [Undibacterium sp.]
MDIRNIAVPRPLPAKPAMTAPTGRPPVKRIAQATPANSPAASATAESPAEPAASSEQTSAITPPVAAGLDLDSLRALARANERKRELTPIEQLRASQERNNSTEARIAAAAKNAQRKDCLTAYTGAGLFAPLLILKDTVTDKGCKW